MSGALLELEDAVLETLRQNAGVQGEFGDPARVFDDVGHKQPIMPYLWVGAHRVEPAHGDAVEVYDHQLDLQILTRWDGRRGAKRAQNTVREAVESTQMAVAGYQLVWCHVAFADSVMLNDRVTHRGIVRIKARTTPRVSD